MTTSTILSDNGATSGSAGLKTTGGNDGTLVIQTTTAGGTATTAMTLGTDQSVTFAQAANLPNTFGFKNRLINGAMMIDQRNAGASVTVNTSSSFFIVDRFFGFGVTSKGVYTLQQATSTPPSGFTNYVRATVTTADAAIGATQGYGFAHVIEGLNVADFGFGASGASTISISFWVRSSLTGTFTAAILNDGQDRSYAASFVINSANTWEYKTLVVSGDTTGTWLKNNGAGLRLYFSFGTGSTWTGTPNTWFAGVRYAATGQVNFISTLGATFDITGVQLEKGSTATSFDYRPYGTELALCQRYCFVLAPSETNIRAGVSGNYGGATAYVTTFLPVSLRGSISVTVSSVSDFKTEELDGGVQTTTAIGLNAGNGNTPITLSVTVGSPLSNPVNLLTNNTSAKITYSSEL